MFGGSVFRVVNLDFEQSFWDQHFDVRVGRIAVGDEFLSSPYYWLFVQNGIDYVRAQQPETSEIFSRIKNNQRLYQLGKELPLTGMSPANIRVQVLDMNSNGRAEKVAEYLSKAGFFLLKIRPAPPNLTHNQVRWAPDMHAQRKTLMQYVHGVHAVMGQTFGPGGAIVVVVGPDFPPQQ